MPSDHDVVSEFPKAHPACEDAMSCQAAALVARAEQAEAELAPFREWAEEKGLPSTKRLRQHVERNHEAAIGTYRSLVEQVETEVKRLGAVVDGLDQSRHSEHNRRRDAEAELAECQTALKQAQDDLAAESLHWVEASRQDRAELERLRIRARREVHHESWCHMTQSPHMHGGVDCDEPHPCDCGYDEAVRIEVKG